METIKLQEEDQRTRRNLNYLMTSIMDVRTESESEEIQFDPTEVFVEYEAPWDGYYGTVHGSYTCIDGIRYDIAYRVVPCPTTFDNMRERLKNPRICPGPVLVRDLKQAREYPKRRRFVPTSIEGQRSVREIGRLLK